MGHRFVRMTNPEAQNIFRHPLISQMRDAERAKRVKREAILRRADLGENLIQAVSENVAR